MELFKSHLFLIPHCLRQFARILCELQTLQPPAAKSATHTSTGHATIGRERLEAVGVNWKHLADGVSTQN